MAVGFRLLGPVEAAVDGQPVPLGHRQLRHTLAVLLVEANRPVSVDQLVDRVWVAQRVPRQPRRAVQHNLALLRRALGSFPEVALARREAGYQLSVDPDTIDLHRFHALLNQARAGQDGYAVSQNDERAAELFEQALALWRDEPCTDLPTDTPWLQTLRSTLTAHQQMARLDLTDIRLRQGRHTTLLADLAEQTTRRPLDERLAGQYLLALYRSGRQSEALEHYHHLQHVLADELGADPTPALQQLHRQILGADPALSAPTPTPVSAASPPATPVPLPVPRQLPAPPRLFTGRTTELADLDRTLDAYTDAGGTGGTVVISAIGGTGGIGKTWLAMHWAYQHLDCFPDGQLYINLRGFDPASTPVMPSTALRGFLAALGAHPACIPSDLDTQVGLYRSLVAGKRMLIVLDNATNIDQIIPLLPGAPECTVLVTSRSQLTGLITTHGARALDLDVLTDIEARELLARHLGTARVTAEPQFVTELLDYCAGLPLAISIVAARASTHPEFSLTILAAELRDHAGRLDALDTGDSDMNLRAVLSWSYNALDSAAATMFRQLGLVPGPDIDLHAAASQTGLPVTKTRTILRRLENAHLVKQRVPGRFQMHDLIRLYAAEQADSDEAENLRSDALRRLVDFYVHTAYRGQRLLNQHRAPVKIDQPIAGCHPRPLTDEAAALAWFDVERPCLLAIQQLAADQGWNTAAWQLAWATHTFHQRRGHLDDSIIAWQTAVAAAQHLGDQSILAHAQRRLGFAYARAGNLTKAFHHLHHALALAEHVGDLLTQADVYHDLVWACEKCGDNQQALAHATRALHFYRTLKVPFLEAQALNSVGWYTARLGDYNAARPFCEAALALYRQLRYRDGEAAVLDSLGYIADHTNQHIEALTYYHEALTIRRALGNNYDEASTLDRLGSTHITLGHHTQARDTWQHALHLYRTQHRTHDIARLEQLLDNL